MDGLSFGIAMGNRYRAEGAERAADILEAAVKQRDARIVELKMELAIARADAHGRKAQVDALLASHANSPLMSASGSLFQNEGQNFGKPKTKIRLIYENAFDKIAASFGIAAPARARLN